VSDYPEGWFEKLGQLANPPDLLTSV